MRVIRAEVLGFCMGVRRAVEMALRVSEQAEPLQAEYLQADYSAVYTLGPLIHNPGILQMLKEREVICLEEGSDHYEETLRQLPQGSTVIIRAHGVSPLVEKTFTEHGLKVLDATCPHVKASQHKARFFSEKGYRIFLAGEENHAEITGIRGYAEGTPYFVIGNPAATELAAAELYRNEPSAKTALIGQTTISSEEYRVIGDEILRYFPKLEIINTICSATAERQKALWELCEKAEALVIAGGRESANTRRLLALAQNLGKPAWLVESAAGLPSEIWNYKTVGLSAGASTPDFLIDEIEEALYFPVFSFAVVTDH